MQSDVSVVAGNDREGSNFRRFAAAADAEPDMPLLGEEGQD